MPSIFDPLKVSDHAIVSLVLPSALWCTLKLVKRMHGVATHNRPADNQGEISFQ